ncbi:major facilitator superfamily domain-containing protein [Lasiosphaeria ovina]|uniref:Major facilitator superfamily domain-containing protein n=1 Tax=Lasiosphaeria ovina TaxID=92902 RepID=A0AAE0TYZ9_9PEZI|nr:major facilitator superfamily domain-containing protein [Lasiosphaeria ovina]
MGPLAPPVRPTMSAADIDKGNSTFVAAPGKDSDLSPADEAQHPAPALSDEKSPGVRRVEALYSILTLQDRIFIFIGVFIIASAYGLDGLLRNAYQNYATASFSQHSLISTVLVLRSVIAAAAQPTSARLADIFGRLQLVCLAVVFYVLGTIVEAVSNNVETFAAGVLIYQVGYTMIILLVEVIIADITSTRERLLYSFIPNAPFLVLVWVSGNVSEAALNITDWRWGIGMWGIIFPVCAIPLIVTLFYAGRRRDTHPIKSLTWALSLSYLFWRLDVIGIILMIAGFALILVPMTIAGGTKATSEAWEAPHVIAPLIIGLIFAIPAFICWQLYTPRPLVPLKLIKTRAVWAAFGIALMLTWAYNMQADYLYTVLVVAFDFDIVMATRITALYTFCSVFTGAILGYVVYRHVYRLKIFIVIGTVFYMVAFGLLIRYRGDADRDSRAGVIGAQVILGVAGGMFAYPTMASLQAYLPHEQLAVITGLFLATYNIGAAFGGAVSGAIWTHVMPNELQSRLAKFGDNATLAASAYNDPLSFAKLYPVSTPERQALIDSIKQTQWLLTIAGICLCLPLIAFSFALPDPKLNNDQTLAGDGAQPSPPARIEGEVSPAPSGPAELRTL